jgi:hypothetical protein
MCTCGIDIATQQHTPAMHNKTCNVIGENGASAWRRAAVAVAPSCWCSIFFRIRKTSGVIATARNSPMPVWVARQPSLR